MRESGERGGRPRSKPPSPVEEEEEVAIRYLSDSADKDFQGELRTLTRVSRQHQDGSWHTHELEIRTAKPPGMGYDEAASLQFTAQEGILAKFIVEDGADGQVSHPADAAAKPGTEKLAAELETLQWTPYQAGHRASWKFTNEVPVTLIELLAKGAVEIGGFRYRFSGPPETPRKFVSRAPLGAA